MSTFDPGVEEAGPVWTRHNLSDHDDVYTAGAAHLADISYNGRIGTWVPNSQLSVPTLAMAAGAGTAPPAATITLDSNDDRGTLSFGTGSAPPAQAAGQPLVVITFGTAIGTPQPFSQPLLANAASGQAVLSLSNALPLPNPGVTVTVAAGPGALETGVVLSVNYATGAVTLTGNLANTHNAPAVVSWTVVKLPYIDLQELSYACRNLFLYPSSVTATGFTISYAGATIAASQGATTFQVVYKCET
jgi:hypothetical protein